MSEFDGEVEEEEDVDDEEDDEEVGNFLYVFLIRYMDEVLGNFFIQFFVFVLECGLFFEGFGVVVWVIEFQEDDGDEFLMFEKILVKYVVWEYNEDDLVFLVV